MKTNKEKAQHHLGCLILRLEQLKGEFKNRIRKMKTEIRHIKFDLDKIKEIKE